jgi:hypothetical protein
LKKEPLFLLIVILAFPHAGVRNSVTHGTIIVIGKSPRRVILAADSRVGRTQTGVGIESVDDSYCKIAALGGHTVFGSSGVIGNSTTADWTALSLATAIATPSTRMNREEGLKFILSWSNSIIKKLAVFSPEQLSAVALQNDGQITTGVLAGMNDDGTTWAQAVTVRYSASVGLTVPTSYDLIAKEHMEYFALGKGEIVREFVDKTSERAKVENAQWAKLKIKRGTRLFDEFEAKRLVDLTIGLEPDKASVGGPIDEVVLDARGSRWLSLKPNCQSGSAKRPDR